jgi:dihydroxyacetone kinase
MTSLDSPGFGVTLLKATSEMLKCIDAPTTAAGWCPPALTASVWSQGITGRTVESVGADVSIENGVKESHAQVDKKLFSQAVSTACYNVISSEKTINAADALVGDGDCGTTLARGANAVLNFSAPP